MEDGYNLVRQRSGIWKSLRDGDFEEEDVWDVLKDKPDCYSPKLGNPKEKKKSSPIPVPRPLLTTTAARMIPRDIRSSTNSIASSSSHETKPIQQSAPVNIPDWSKIYRPKNVSKFDDYDYDGDEGVVKYGGDNNYEDEEEDDDEDEYEYDSKLPPHEFIARRLARSQISSFSVLEGVGRTLKGRDLSKVRNAVLSKTGFLESL